MNTALFEISCYYFNKKIRTTKEYWQKIINEKHPSIKGNEWKVKSALQNPDEIRQSKTNKNIFLFYRLVNSKYICVIIKLLNSEGFIITAYFTIKVKEGELIWKK